ncbi:MAG TPA: efflux RND transporter periplasmic adaptor subunit, partial [Candidatus Binatia bacterium]|nr:efflux RND transporter periplasmic adaptor subunit [Candidatus Binatia bacterium]
MNSDDISEPTEDRKDLATPAPEARGAEKSPAPPAPDSKRKPVEILVSLSLGLILLAGAAAVAWQFFGEQLKKAGWFTALTGHRRVQDASKQGEIYYCPMHKEYQSDKPGNCPICSMQLVKLEKPAAAQGVSTESTGGSAPSMQGMQMPGMQMPDKPEAGENTILISPQQRQLIGVQTVPAEFRLLDKEIRAVGKIAYDETRVTHIHTKFSGWAEQVFVDFVGKFVKQGDPLFTVYSPELVSTQEEYLLALRARKELGSSSFERIANGADRLVQAARRRLSLWDVTDAEIARLEKEGKARRELTIFSPVSGLVTERAAYHHGRYVTPEMDLYTIVDLSTVWALGEIYEYELPLVRLGQRVEVDLPYESASAPIRGAVTYVYPYLNPTTRTAQIRMEFTNQGYRLKPDMFVNVKLRVNQGRQLTVPEDAVLDTGTQQYVFVDKGEGYFEPRLIRVGAQAGGYYGIKEGLKEGEKVATAANFILDSESRLKGAFEAMGRPKAEMPRAQTAAAQLQITLRTEPDPAKVGDNMLRVRVMDAGGAPVTDASVRIKISMPA